MDAEIVEVVEEPAEIGERCLCQWEFRVCSSNNETIVHSEYSDVENGNQCSICNGLHSNISVTNCPGLERSSSFIELADNLQADVANRCHTGNACTCNNPEGRSHSSDNNNTCRPTCFSNKTCLLQVPVSRVDRPTTTATDVRDSNSWLESVSDVIQMDDSVEGSLDALSSCSQAQAGFGQDNVYQRSGDSFLYETADRPQYNGSANSSCCEQGSARSYVSVFCTFSIMFLIVGVMSSFGVFYVELLEYYGHGPSSTSLIGSINSGVCHAAAALVGLIEAKIGIRKTVIFGGFLSALGLAVSSAMPSMVILYLSYGVVCGTGFALAYTASIGVLAYHFDCQRSLDIAVGVATSGMGFGVLALPPLIRVVIDAYGWKGSMLLCSGLALNICVFAALSGPAPKQQNELIRTLSVASMVYIRKAKERLYPKNEIISMSMTSIYIRQERELSGHSHERKLTKNTASVSQSVPTKPPDTVTPRRLEEDGMSFFSRFPQLAVLKSKIFLLVLLSEILSNMTIGTTLTTITDYAHCNGHDLFKSSILLSIYGVFATLGRLYLAFFSAAVRRFKSHKRITIATTNLITVFSTFCIGFTGENYYLLSFMVALFGLSSGAKGTFVYCYVIKILGTQNVITAMGLLGLSCGIGQFGGPPLAGLLFLWTEYYPIVYFFGAVSSVLAALCIIAIIIIRFKDGKTGKTESMASRDVPYQGGVKEAKQLL